MEDKKFDWEAKYISKSNLNSDIIFKSLGNNARMQVNSILTDVYSPEQSILRAKHLFSRLLNAY